jgi:hypothetical protein
MTTFVFSHYVQFKILCILLQSGDYLLIPGGLRTRRKDPAMGQLKYRQEVLLTKFFRIPSPGKV